MSDRKNKVRLRTGCFLYDRRFQNAIIDHKVTLFTDCKLCISKAVELEDLGLLYYPNIYLEGPEENHNPSQDCWSTGRNSNQIQSKIANHYTDVYVKNKVLTSIVRALNTPILRSCDRSEGSGGPARWYHEPWRYRNRMNPCIEKLTRGFLEMKANALVWFVTVPRVSHAATSQGQTTVIKRRRAKYRCVSNTTSVRSQWLAVKFFVNDTVSLQHLQCILYYSCPQIPSQILL
jgi:hypothetical protein